MLKASMYLTLLAIIMKLIGKEVIETDYILHIAVVVLALAGSGYTACILQFTLDQLVGASGEQLTFAIYWLIWGGFTTACFTNMFYYISFQNSKYLLHSVSILSILIAVCMMECCNHWLMKKPLLSNPIKHIAKVLNYARKHKYPERRSAFTYWEEDYPSRIDLGKDKYGGPFTVEEVEDVKTSFRLIVLIMSSTAYVFAWQCKSQGITAKNPLGWLNQSSAHSSTMLQGLLSFFGLPIYHFILYPLFYNYIPGLLKRVGLGMLLLLLSLFSSSILQLTEPSVTCVIPVNNGTMSDPVTSYWQLVPNIEFGLSIVISVFTFIELVICQSPCQMKGMILTLSFAFCGLYNIVGYILNIIVQTYIIPLFSECAFYHYIFHLALLVIVLIVYVIIAKWYNFRKRNDVIPYHMFAEECFEKNQKQEKNYQKYMYLTF